MKHPATKTVHWPTGPVHACDEHADKLVRLANFLGSHVGVEDAPQDSTCMNCVNEHKASDEIHP